MWSTGIRSSKYDAWHVVRLNFKQRGPVDAARKVRPKPWLIPDTSWAKHSQFSHDYTPSQTSQHGACGATKQRMPRPETSFLSSPVQMFPPQRQRHEALRKLHTQSPRRVTHTATC